MCDSSWSATNTIPRSGRRKHLDRRTSERVLEGTFEIDVCRMSQVADYVP